jgi:hypothetical protein
MEVSFDSLDDWMSMNEVPGVQAMNEYPQRVGGLFLGFEVNEL